MGFGWVRIREEGTTMKFTKTSEKQLREYFSKMDASGCVVASDWTSGSGRFTKPKALPPFVQRFERKEYAKTALPKHGAPERVAFEFFGKNPRRKTVLVLDKEAALAFFFEAAHGREI